MDVEGWGLNAVEALKLQLVRSKEETEALTESERVRVEVFQPMFVYPIFGDEETIFGYRDLEVQLKFASGSLNQYLHIKYSSKFPETAAVKADDPEQTLYEFIPPSYSKIASEFEKTVEEESKTFKPFGTKVRAYRSNSSSTTNLSKNGKGKGKAKASLSTVHLPERNWELLEESDTGDDEEVLFEAYASNWHTPGFKEYHRRMQIFVLLYIEGATYIEEDDERWEFLTLFERRKRGDHFVYHFVGYTTFYSFLCWPDTKRLRLSQFVILPPYQGQGHGSALYTVAYQRILQRPEISELTVEDPAEAFEDMRDKCDLYTLLSAGDLNGLEAPIERSVTEEIRKRYKLADRQFYRLVEMICLLHLDTSNEQAKKAYRLLVKKRLYLFNREMLLQIEPQERKDRLQETFEGVERDYRRIIKQFT